MASITNMKVFAHTSMQDMPKPIRERWTKFYIWNVAVDAIYNKRDVSGRQDHLIKGSECKVN